MKGQQVRRLDSSFPAPQSSKGNCSYYLFAPPYGDLNSSGEILKCFLNSLWRQLRFRNPQRVAIWASQLMPGNWRADPEDLELVSVESNEDGTETVIVRRKISVGNLGDGPEYLRTTVEQIP